MSNASHRILTDAMVDEIRSYFDRYPTKQAVTLPALHVVNRELRHVPLQAVVEVAKLLELHPAEVQDTLSFYGFFKQDQPHGDLRVWVCCSISCALRGADGLLQRMCQRAGIRAGGTTDSGRLTIEYAECLGACEQAPCMLAGEELVGNLDDAAADRFVDQTS